MDLNIVPTPTENPLVSSSILIEARDLFCERDERILFSGLNFHVQPGELVQIKGSNGSGKTSLLRILCGLNEDFSGEILWKGEPLTEVREDFLGSMIYIGHRAGVSRILTPRENLRWSASLHSPANDEHIVKALGRLGLRAYEDIPCRNLSAGQTQRVALARLLISAASLWILDEPFTTLDVYGVKNLEDLLSEHVDSGGAVILTTHHTLNVSCKSRAINLDAQRTSI